MWTKPGDAVQKTELHEVEADKAHERRKHEPRGTARARRARASPRPAASCSDSAWSCRHRAIRPTRAAGRRQGADRPFGDDVLVHRVVGPARAAAVEQAHVPVGIAFAMAQASGRENGCAAPSCTPRRAGVCRSRARRESTPRAPATGARRHRGTAPSRASPAPTAKFFCAPNPSHSCSMTRAPQRRAISTVSSPLPESTTTISAANGTDARQSRELGGGIAGDHTKAQGERPGHAPNGRGAGGSARE